MDYVSGVEGVLGLVGESQWLGLGHSGGIAEAQKAETQADTITEEAACKLESELHIIDTEMRRSTEPEAFWEPGTLKAGGGCLPSSLFQEQTS